MQNFFVLVYFVCHTPQFKMLVFAFRSEIWIVQNFNFTVFEDFSLSLSWKYRFLQNINHAKVQFKTNKYCKIHVDRTRRRLSKSRFKKLGMVPKKLYRNTLNVSRANISHRCSFLQKQSLPLVFPRANRAHNCCLARPGKW